jgi:hypothetical protein
MGELFQSNFLSTEQSRIDMILPLIPVLNTIGKKMQLNNISLNESISSNFTLDFVNTSLEELSNGTMMLLNRSFGDGVELP